MDPPTTRNPGTAQPRNDQTLKEYKRAWLLVNTRSFYWDYPTPAFECDRDRRRKCKTASEEKGADEGYYEGKDEIAGKG